MTDASRGDAPFVAEEALFGWLPRTGALLAIGVVVLLLALAVGHRGDYRLVPSDQGAVLERGDFAPWGWERHFPSDGQVAWEPVPWDVGPDAPAMRGELRELSDVFYDLLAARVTAAGSDTDALLAAMKRVELFQEWYLDEFDEDPARAPEVRQTLDGVQQSRAREADLDQAAAEQARAQRETSRVRAHNAARRRLLADVEGFIDSLPPTGQGSAEEERDRVLIRDFIDAMDAPLRPPAEAPTPP